VNLKKKKAKFRHHCFSRKGKEEKSGMKRFPHLFPSVISSVRNNESSTQLGENSLVS